jgi:hypothetical protein
LADTVEDNIGIGDAAMSGDGNKLVFAASDVDTGDARFYTVDASGANRTSISLPGDVIGIVEVAIDQDGSRAFFLDSDRRFFRVEGGVATQILDAADYPEIFLCSQIQTTADGESLYFLDDEVNDNDVWRVGHTGGTPEIIIDDALVTHSGFVGNQVQDFAISDDAGVIAFSMFGYVDQGTIVTRDELFVLSGGFSQLTSDAVHVAKDYVRISGDGSTIVYSEGGEWYSIHPDGTGKTFLENTGFNLGGPDLTQDGAVMFYGDSASDGDLLMNTDGSGRHYLFPRWNVGAIAIAATSSLNISDDGQRVSFVLQYSSFPFLEALYVGYLNTPDAVPDAPSIDSIAFSPASMPRGDPDARVNLTVDISDPDGSDDITRISLDHLLDGQIVVGSDKLPARFPFAPHDDGTAPDTLADDGIFASEGQPADLIDDLDSVIVRLGVKDSTETVVIADTTLPIGASP